MRAAAVGLVTGLLSLAVVSAGAPSWTSAPRTSEEMRRAAVEFLQTLDGAQRDQATYAFEDDERFNWHFIPRDRNGLPLREMNPEQRMAAHALMQAALSSTGYLKATSVMALETVLRELGGGARRDPEGYFFTIFGDPASTTEPWGWRVEGHHLSINFTSATGEVVASTPAFMGSNPAQVRSGPSTGLRVLGAEEDMARTLLGMLDGAQRERAVIAAEAPRDIITGADREASLERMEGLPASEMTQPQRDLLMRILREYIGNMAPEIAAPRIARIQEMGFERLHFAWAGSAEPGEGHYYRIHGPTVLIEYDNTQGNANHAHSVWRDLENDFGADLLRQHYEEAEHHRHERGQGRR